MALYPQYRALNSIGNVSKVTILWYEKALGIRQVIISNSRNISWNKLYGELKHKMQRYSLLSSQCSTVPPHLTICYTSPLGWLFFSYKLAPSPMRSRFYPCSDEVPILNANLSFLIVLDPNTHQKSLLPASIIPVFHSHLCFTIFPFPCFQSLSSIFPIPTPGVLYAPFPP